MIFVGNESSSNAGIDAQREHHAPPRVNASLRARLRACRSFHLTPGSKPDDFSAARAVGGDGIIVDLESRVAPCDKERAREAALTFFRQPGETDFVRVLRINSPRSVEGLRDLIALHEADARPDAVIIPKCQSANEIRVVAEILDGSQSTIGIMPMVELARALFVVDQMADADERVCGLFLGGGDLAADLGTDGDWENLLFARSCVVAAAATTGIAAIDVPYFKADDAGLLNEAAASRRLGMTGKAALQAEQLVAINTIFTPSSDAVAQARSVISVVARANGSAPVLNGHVIEPAMLREAERVRTIAEKLRNHQSPAAG